MGRTLEQGNPEVCVLGHVRADLGVERATMRPFDLVVKVGNTVRRRSKPNLDPSVRSARSLADAADADPRGDQAGQDDGRGERCDRRLDSSRGTCVVDSGVGAARNAAVG
jgi:hypothetical protein